jgi:hypothetical protein
MGVFRRKARDAIFGPEPVDIDTAVPPDPDPAEIKVARTLVKSEPELAELVAAESRLSADGIAVSLVEKGFGTRVEIRATPGSGFAEPDLEGLLDTLGEPQKRPFSAT